MGIDVVAVSRIRRALDRSGDRFVTRILGPEERASWGTEPQAVALCFAVKEAVVKALGGWGQGFAWTSVAVERGATDLPEPVLAAVAAARVAIQTGRWTKGGSMPAAGWWVAGPTATGDHVLAVAGAAAERAATAAARPPS